MSSKRVLIIGPFPNPVTGMAFSNKVVYEGLKAINPCVRKINFSESRFSTKKNLNITHGKISIHKILNTLSYLECYKILLVNTVYITIGLTFFGLLKYAPFIVFSRLFNKNLVFHLHGNHIHKTIKKLRGIKKNIFLWLLNSFDKGIVLSEIIKNNLALYYPDKKISIIYNFVENSQINFYHQNQKSKDYSDIKLLYMSNIIPSKGIYELLEALNILNGQGFIIKTTIAGELPKSELKRFYSLLSKNENIYYQGVIHNEQKWNIIQEHNTFCLPTYFPMEGQPISILENMAAGNLIITTKHAGIPDICNDSNAIFANKKSIQDLCSAIKKISLNPEIIQKMGVQSFLTSHTKYSENIFLKNMQETLNSKN